MPAEAQLGDQRPTSKVHGPQLHRHKVRRGLFPSLYVVFSEDGEGSLLPVVVLGEEGTVVDACPRLCCLLLLTSVLQPTPLYQKQRQVTELSPGAHLI